MASLQKLLFVQKYLCQIWSGFLARKGFFQMNLPYFSKYWKVWLAFDGWKLSGLFVSTLFLETLVELAILYFFASVNEMTIEAITRFI
jgi:hypothetical protein